MDRRETAYDPFYGTFNESTMIGYLYGHRPDEEGWKGEVIPVHCHFEICETCNGRGSHVNPSIDSHGIGQEEFDEDPDFAESYFAGHYDVSCAECKGRRVSPIPDENDPNIDQYWEAVQGHYEYMREIAAERRVGA